jgi:sugar lactone lactonase YvrE
MIFAQPGTISEDIMKARNIVIVLSVGLIFQSCASVQQTDDRIVAERGGFIPEGIEYDYNDGRFLTGSLSDGTVYEITSNGSLVVAVEDSELMSSVGIEADEPRNRLLVTNSDRTNPDGAAYLGVYELDSGAKLAMVNLAATIENLPADAIYFANDVAVSTRGVAYVTDTRMNIIYKVDTYYNGSVLFDFGRDNGLNINGIEFHPAGYLLVVSPGTGQLLKVPVDNPRRWSFVDLDLPATGGDGLVWAADGSLAVISNNLSRVTKYTSVDNWRTATVTGMASFEGQGTTGAAVGDDIYVVQPHFADAEPPVILKARF